MLTKKRMAILTVLVTIIYFIPMLFFPESIVGARTENMIMFAFKITFLSMTAAITTAFIILFIFKRDYINAQISTFKRFRHLLQMMVKRDFVSRYRKSVLGVLWSLLNPLLTMLVMTMVFSRLFRFQIENFPVYLLSGQIIFLFFNEATTQAMSSVIMSGAVIKKVYVPKYIFPLVRVTSSLVNLSFSILALFLVIIVTRAPFFWTMLLLPVPIIYVFVFSLGIGLMLSSMAVFFRDLTYLYGIALTLLMYLTPIFWPISILDESPLRSFMGLNPMYQFIDYFRALVYRGTVPGLWTNAVCAGFALAALCVGVYAFMSKQDKYILYL